MDDSARLVELAKATLKAAYRRAAKAPALRLGDPSWYVLLDLFVCDFVGRVVTVSGASAASNVAHTTGLRNVNNLLNAGYVRDYRDASDGRRRLLKLTPAGVELVTECLRELETGAAERIAKFEQCGASQVLSTQRAAE